MKKIILLTTLISLSLNVFAKNLEFSNKEGSEQAELCIAAATSKDSLKTMMQKYSYNKLDLKSFSCNGLSIAKFAKKYSDKNNSANKKTAGFVEVFSFSNSTESAEAAICIAAATSNEAYNEAKEKFGITGKAFLKEISCNRLSLPRFAKKYGNKNFSL